MRSASVSCDTEAIMKKFINKQENVSFKSVAFDSYYRNSYLWIECEQKKNLL